MAILTERLCAVGTALTKARVILAANAEEERQHGNGLHAYR